MAKKFCPVTYKNNDAIAKKVLMIYLYLIGYELLTSKEGYDGDVKTEIVIDGKKHHVVHEAELAGFHRWFNGPYPEDNITIPYRKKRLLEKHKESILLFWTISNDLSEAYCIRSKELTEERKGRKKCYMPVEGEEEQEGVDEFYFIPIEFCKRIKLRRK